MSAHKKRKHSLIVSVYYTIFLLFRDFAPYADGEGVNVASTFVAFVCVALAVMTCTLAAWITGVPFFAAHWFWALLGCSVALVNNHFLVSKDRGNKFGDEFAGYSERKRMMLYIAAIVTVVAIVAGSVFSALAYRHAHGF